MYCFYNKYENIYCKNNAEVDGTLFSNKSKKCYFTFTNESC